MGGRSRLLSRAAALRTTATPPCAVAPTPRGTQLTPSLVRSAPRPAAVARRPARSTRRWTPVTRSPATLARCGAVAAPPPDAPVPSYAAVPRSPTGLTPRPDDRPAFCRRVRVVRQHGHGRSRGPHALSGPRHAACRGGHGGCGGRSTFWHRARTSRNRLHPIALQRSRVARLRSVCERRPLPSDRATGTRRLPGRVGRSGKATPLESRVPCSIGHHRRPAGRNSLCGGPCGSAGSASGDVLRGGRSGEPTDVQTSFSVLHAAIAFPRSQAASTTTLPDTACTAASRSERARSRRECPDGSADSVQRQLRYLLIRKQLREHPLAIRQELACRADDCRLLVVDPPQSSLVELVDRRIRKREEDGRMRGDDELAALLREVEDPAQHAHLT